jgi:hypothetical protein
VSIAVEGSGRAFFFSEERLRGKASAAGEGNASSYLDRTLSMR